MFGATMRNFLEERSIMMATEIISTFTQGTNAPTMTTARTQFSPDAVPFQSRNNTGFINNNIEGQTIQQDATPSTSNGFIGHQNDFSQINQSEPPQEASNSEKENNSGAEAAAGLITDASDNIFSLLNTDDLIQQCLSTASYYASMLTREQQNVLRSIRPVVLYSFLVEVAKVRHRLQRQVIDECAFCKNNGENEDFYLSHALKDNRGRVRCPVLRAFRCPRCGATGDWAHTIKYCPYRSDGFERNAYINRRRVNSPPPSVTLGFSRIAEARRVVGVNTEEPLFTPANDEMYANFGAH